MKSPATMLRHHVVMETQHCQIKLVMTLLLSLVTCRRWEELGVG